MESPAVGVRLGAELQAELQASLQTLERDQERHERMMAQLLAKSQTLLKKAKSKMLAPTPVPDEDDEDELEDAEPTKAAVGEEEKRLSQEEDTEEAKEQISKLLKAPKAIQRLVESLDAAASFIPGHADEINKLSGRIQEELDYCYKDFQMVKQHHAQWRDDLDAEEEERKRQALLDVRRRSRSYTELPEAGDVSGEGDSEGQRAMGPFAEKEQKQLFIYYSAADALLHLAGWTRMVKDVGLMDRYHLNRQDLQNIFNQHAERLTKGMEFRHFTRSIRYLAVHLDMPLETISQRFKHLNTSLHVGKVLSTSARGPSSSMRPSSLRKSLAAPSAGPRGRLLKGGKGRAAAEAAAKPKQHFLAILSTVTAQAAEESPLQQDGKVVVEAQFDDEEALPIIMNTTWSDHNLGET
ncbi:unnamed protein product [Vitrella brassicaformis CCMP3155]|uniref:Uncharacterized protein n=2 Tax=Vitrella brassicaformis TaxID=1169539 RepID=A0A0G4EP21_VITBC|nr:unnamed protein product [Vitrella brassicaformis CCMP3155]|mmetsp:Transcript_31390/g.77782  ORF Transcript_31390/g.77782 Transcript_31390/m.77782 type:complete len:410 (+) Transcript_31390:194-1423(+)|eukprot:CEL99201.1 unnamed protein product [Vitrella brassicaformis CCMP3155]